MLLGEILHRGVIKPELAAQEKFAAIDELIEVLIEAKDLPHHLRDAVRGPVVARERSMSTGMEMGIALPHGSCDRIENMMGALGISPNGIDFDCLDGEPARLILLLVLPRHEFQIHVRTLAGISHLLQEATFRDALMTAKDPDTILKLIRGEEQSSIFDGFRRRFK